MTHQVTVTRLLGVDPDKKGAQMLRTRAFQGDCEECGRIGRPRDNWFTARSDAQQHMQAHRRDGEGGDTDGGL